MDTDSEGKITAISPGNESSPIMEAQQVWADEENG